MRQQLRNINPYIDPDNSFYDRASDENFELDESDASSGEFEEDLGSSDEEFKEVTRENYHSQQQN